MNTRTKITPEVAHKVRTFRRMGPTGIDLLSPASRRLHKGGGTRTPDFVYESILRAYVTGRLPPGTRLPEIQLADIFEVSRERVRKVLQRLAHERWLEIHRNRGAVVPRPTMEDAREVIQARVIMESGIVDQLLVTPRLIDRDAVSRHIAAEQAAKRARHEVQMTRLTADFHILIAGFLRNPWISRHLEELVLRSLVFVALYGDAAGPTCCGPDEHRQVARWLLAGDLEQTRTAMISHLRGLELYLDFRTDRTLQLPLERIFLPDAGARR